MLFQPGLGGGRLEPDGKTPGAVARSPPLARNGFEAVMETGQVLVGLAAFAQQRRGEQPAEPGHVLQRFERAPGVGGARIPLPL